MRRLLLLAAVLGAAPAGAQPAGMPDLRAMMGRPLPAGDLPAGTVTVRLARKLPGNAVAGVEVTAIVKNGSESRKRVEKSDAQGRATFSALPPGATFTAEATIDGERLATRTFPVAPAGGVRTMLIAGLGGPRPDGEEAGPGGPGGGDEGDAGGFRLGAATGAGTPDDKVAAGTIEVHLLATDKAMASNRTVLLGVSTRDAGLSVRQAMSDGEGVARFSGLPADAQFAAVVEHEGMRLGTEPFSLPATSGVRAEIRLAPRSTDASGLRLGPGSRFVMTQREGAFEVLEILTVENRGASVVDPGPAGLRIPLPAGAVNAQALDSDERLEIIEKSGVALHAPIPPGGTEVRFAFILPTLRGRLPFEQPMPIGLSEVTVVTERIAGLEVEGQPRLERQEREMNGRPLLVLTGGAVPAGGTLSVLLSGLPSADRGGQRVAGVLALLLIVGAILGGGQPSEAVRKRRADRARLDERRERLFDELVALERRRLDGGAPPTMDARRQELVGKLEAVYRELAAQGDAA